MPNYRYKGRQRGGGPVQGTLTAPSAGALAEQLLNRGIEPLQIEEEKPKAVGGGVLHPVVNRPSADDLLLFTRQMYTLSRSGVPLIRALQGLMDTTSNAMLVAAMRKIIDGVQAGRSLSVCLADHPRIFSVLYVRIVNIGEETGRLEESFHQLHRYMEVEKQTRKQIKSALRYPTFVMGAMVVAMFVLNYFVIPAFAGVFKQFGAELPWATRVLINTSSFTKQYVVHILVGAVGGVVYYINSEKGRLWWDEFKMGLPLAGHILQRATLARFARAFAMGSRSGLPLLQILNGIAEAVDNAFVAKKVLEMRAGIERGESLVQAAYVSQMFTPLVLQMIGVGEETGAMDEMMQEVAEFYEREVEYDVNALSSTIEPIIVGSIAVMVLVLALGIFMPMWDMGQAAMRR